MRSPINFLPSLYTTVLPTTVTPASPHSSCQQETIALFKQGWSHSTALSKAIFYLKGISCISCIMTHPNFSTHTLMKRLNNFQHLWRNTTLLEYLPWIQNHMLSSDPQTSQIMNLHAHAPSPSTAWQQKSYPDSHDPF